MKKGSGFEVVWGPVLAKDIPAFMQAGCKAQPGMRQRSFTLLERAVLVPNEIHAMLKFMLSYLPVFQILGILTTPGSWVEGLARGTLAMLWTLGGGLVGGALGPLLLPWLPGRAFALKALILAVIYGLIILGVHGVRKPDRLGPGPIEPGLWLFHAHELHRLVHLHLAFRGAAGDATGGSPAGRRSPLRSRGLAIWGIGEQSYVCFSLY